ncbi:hypothetical protein H0H81_012518 [Sphagnurus paluster]|uniref:RanBD1 domain-containing protein n=1 Tax=Sphagnurus paluster TaxID=117069 RepID=A0A9P7FUM8_9AGAR|nr:hypothetical protein H0H81_012518 [Sphagnurus paluster]
MKRGAEKQLIKDDTDREEDEETPGQGFRKADEKVLSSRPMRGLPKRSQTLSAGAMQNPTPSPAPVSESSSSTTPKFGGFSGFASPTSSFSFTPPPVAPLSDIATPQPSFFKPATTPQTVAPTASNTAKTSASFLESTSSNPPTPSMPPASAPPSQDPSDGGDPVSLKYYTSLRGLNVSFLEALSKATDEDPFTDISPLLDHYKSLRLDVQKEFDDKSKKPTETPVPPKPSTMPAAPTSFAGFGQPSTSTSSFSSESSSTGGGFQFKPTSSSSTPASGFSFSPAVTPPATTSSGFSFAVPPTGLNTSANPFALPSSSASPFGAPSSTPSPFGTAGGSAPSPSPFALGGTSTPSTSTEKATSSTSAFGTFGSSSVFGASKPFGTPEKSTSPASFGFGGSSAFGNSSSSSNAFGFDKSTFSSSPPPKPASFGGFGGFGKPAGTGSIGNPVGFGFGSPPKNTEAGASGAASSSSNTVDKGDDGATESQETDPPPPIFGGLNTKSPHDEEGEGEEQEETVHAVKLKAFRLSKGESGSSWLELGYGVLRLKKHKETEARRLLLRNSSTGKININFNIYSGLKPTQSKKALTFIGHDEAGASHTYSVRLQNEEHATSLKEAIDREIAFVKAKSDG